MLGSRAKKGRFAQPDLPSYATGSCCHSDVKFEASLINTLLVTPELGPVLRECPWLL